MKRTWRMHTKILLLCLGVTFSALILQMILFELSSSKMIYKQAKNESFHSLENMQEDVYDLIKRIEKVLIESYNEREFMHDLKEKTDIEVLRDKYPREAYNLATSHFETTDGVVALYLYNMENEIISTYRRAVTPKHNYPLDIYETDKDYHANVVKDYVASERTDMMISSYYNMAREKEILRFVLKFYNNGNSRNTIGYVVCDVDSKTLVEIMKKYSSEDMYLWFQPMGDRPAVSYGTIDENEKAALEEFQKSISAGRQGDKKRSSPAAASFFR